MSLLTSLLFNLKIVPINDKGFPFGIPYVAMFNPENIAIKEDLVWGAECGPGGSGSPMHYKKTNPRTFTLDMIVDGTGVNTGGLKITPVTVQVALFRAATSGVRGVLHQPAFLIVQYGLFICTCVLNSSTVTYTLFDSTGLPIRAKISASFTEHTVKTLSNITDMLSSADLTHRRIAGDGDLLPLLTYQIYNNQNYYLQVAKANKLKNFRKLLRGTELVFPRIANTKK
jgi:hypothetical protein